MPTSHFYQLNEIAELIMRLAPKSVLDIGTGFGKFGVLSREYLDVWRERTEKKDWKIRIDGIEAFPSNLSSLHSFVYDKIYIGEASKVLNEIQTEYDLILLIDILEHFEKEQGFEILRRCQAVARNTIVSTPKDIRAQGAVHGNPFEEHKAQWRKRDFTEFPNRFFISNTKSYLCCFGKDAKKLRQKISMRRLIAGFRNGFEGAGDLLLGR